MNSFGSYQIKCGFFSFGLKMFCLSLRIRVLEACLDWNVALVCLLALLSTYSSRISHRNLDLLKLVFVILGQASSSSRELHCKFANILGSYLLWIQLAPWDMREGVGHWTIWTYANIVTIVSKIKLSSLKFPSKEAVHHKGYSYFQNPCWVNKGCDY